MDRVMFCNSGAEANETAIKLARKYGKRNGGARTEIVTAWNSFHGRTLGALSATGQPKYQQSFTPMVPDFTHVEFNNLAAMDAAITDRTCAVMLEPVMGESGVYAATPEYLAGVRRLCDERDVLLMLDEVQTGLGRTGKLFAYEHFGIEPDVLALSKALGGGMPIGALLAKEHVAIFERGDHGTTFGGTAIAAAAALAAVTAILEEELPANAARIGAQLSTRFAELKAGNNLVSDFRVCGCMAAIDLAAPVAAQVRVMAQDLGLLILTVGDSMLRLLPALICTPEQADDAVQIISKALEACAVPAG
jgi:acetylornithine/succinyldiaminopimelate/putrescine aminotransferase